MERASESERERARASESERERESARERESERQRNMQIEFVHMSGASPPLLKKLLDCCGLARRCRFLEASGVSQSNPETAARCEATPERGAARLHQAPPEPKAPATTPPPLVLSGHAASLTPY